MFDFLDKNKALAAAAAAGDVAKVRKLLAKGADGRAALWLAVQSGREEVAKALLEHGVSPSVAGEGGKTPLLMAAAAGREELVGALLAAGAALDARDATRLTPLGAAIENGHEALAARLLERGADPNSEAGQGQTVLHAACRKGMASLCKELLRKGADKEARDAEGNTPLLVACAHGQAHTVRSFLEWGANPNATGERGRTAAEIALSRGDIQLARELAGRVTRTADPTEDVRRCLLPALGYLQREAESLLEGAQPVRAASGLPTFTRGDSVRRREERISRPFNRVLEEAQRLFPGEKAIQALAKLPDSGASGDAVTVVAEENRKCGEALERILELTTCLSLVSPRHSREIPARAGQGPLRLTETSQGRFKKDIAAGSLRSSPNAARMAYAVLRGQRMAVVLDGQGEAREFDRVVPESLRFSPDSRRFGYAVIRGGKAFFMVDGIESEGYAAPGKDSPIFSPDSRRVAWAAAARPFETFYVIDGTRGSQYAGVSHLLFSPDSRRTIYFAKDPSGSHRVILDGQAYGPYEGVYAPVVFSPDSRRVAWAAQKGGGKTVFIDGEPQPAFEDMMPLKFSPDSRHFAYPIKKSGKWHVCLDGQLGPAFEAVGSSGVTFRPDSSSMMFAAARTVPGKGQKWFLVEGERWIGDGGDGIGRNSPAFSPDSRRLAYAVQEGRKWRVIVDDQPGPLVDGVSDPIFSADSNHSAYHATEGQVNSVICDGRQGRRYRGVAGTGLLFSPDSRRLVYDVTKDEGHYIVVDEEEIGPYAGFAATSELVFERGNLLRAMALRGYDLVKVEIEM